MVCETGPAALNAAILKLLIHSDLFGGVPEVVLLDVASATRVRKLVASEMLMRRGDEGESLYLVIEGTLRLCSRDGDHVRFEKLVHPGAVIGELALITGFPRAATAIAEGDSTVAELTCEELRRLMASHPDALASVKKAIQARLERYQVASAAQASSLANRMSEPLRTEFLARLRMTSIASGMTLMRAGEIGDKMYLIVAGRFRVFGELPEVTIAELGKGDTVGETALMTGDRRSATVIALRDSLVAELNTEDFKSLIERFPLEMMSILTLQLTERTREKARGKEQDRLPASIAIVPLTDAVDAVALVSRLERALSGFGEVLTVSMDTPMVRRATASSETRLVEWLSEQENRFRHVVYETDGRPGEWTQRSLRQADRIYLVADVSGDLASALDRLQILIRKTSGQVTDAAKDYQLILLHAPNAAVSVATADWRTAFPMLREHHHVRLDQDGDFGRLARSINHRLVGLALGGGFALGIAHVGVIRAMRELKIPIDCVGGTSMGAVIAAECAMDFEYEQMLDIIVNGCASSLKGDYTLPFLSLLSGAKLARTLGRYLERHTLEDFWLPYFSISASLRQAMMVVHREGDALRSVLASCRAPGMFPPLPWAGDLLVDGGLVNNIPADVMRTCVRGGTVFAVDVSPQGEMAEASDESLSVSGWARARCRLQSRGEPQALSLIDVLGRIIRLGGVSRAQAIRADADCYLQPHLAHFKALDFERGREIAESSYRYALGELGLWMQQNGRPWDRVSSGFSQ